MLRMTRRKSGISNALHGKDLTIRNDEILLSSVEVDVGKGEKPTRTWESSGKRGSGFLFCPVRNGASLFTVYSPEICVMLTTSRNSACRDLEAH